VQADARIDNFGKKENKTVTVVYYPGLEHYDNTAPLLIDVDLIDDERV
jgi:hypothetical protein